MLKTCRNINSLKQMCTRLARTRLVPRARAAPACRARGATAPAQPTARGAHRAHSALTPRSNPLPPPSQSPDTQQGETLNGQRLIEFRLGREDGESEGLTVQSAELMVRAETSPRAPRHLRYTLWAFTVGENGTVGDLAGAARRGPSRGWRRLDVTAAARRWAGGGAAQPLRLLLDCSGCAGLVRLRLGGAAAARPLLRLRVAPPVARRRRALACDDAPHGACCRQTYYVSFRKLGWDDWIVAPEGYYANYCRGECGRSAYSYNSQLMEEVRPGRTACCAPVRFSALSLIYFGDDSNIIKRDLPEMVVEECDCP